MATIPKDVHAVKIAEPTKRILVALKKDDQKEIISACEDLCLKISSIIDAPWVTGDIFRELVDMDQWASTIKARAESNLKK